MRDNDYCFLRRVARASWCFVSVASCSFESSHQFSSSSSESSKKRRRRRDVLSNTKNLPDVSPAVAKRALAELSRRQRVLDYEPSAEEKRTVNEFVNGAIARVVVACGLTGAFGYASSDGTMLGFKNKTNVFRARVVVGVATGILGGLFEYRSVNFYRNLLVKVLDAQEDGSKMSGELAQILRETDPLGALVRDQDRKKNRERLSGFRVGRERMVAAVFAEHRETRREGEEKEEAHSNTTARFEHHRERRRRLGTPSPFVFADVFETSPDDERRPPPAGASSSSSSSSSSVDETERHKRRLAFRTKELERRKRIKEIGLERRRHTGGGGGQDVAVFDA